MLAKELGPKSAVGVEVISWLGERLGERPDRRAVVAEWQQGMGRGGTASLPGGVRGQGPLAPAEKLVCLQAYYALVVQTVAWKHLVLARGGVPESAAGIGGLISGEVFARLGVANLGLEGLPPWFGESGWPPETRGLVAAVWRMDLNSGRGSDIFQKLYEGIISREIRYAAGEHYTPSWLVNHVLDGIDYQGEENISMLDPACGSGAFLVEVLNRRRAAGCLPGSENKLVTGFDVNPLAVLTARVNFLLAGGYTPGPGHSLEIPVYLKDVILSSGEGLWSEAQPRFDLMVGNPPWLNWEALDSGYRAGTVGLWKYYGLFPHGGMDAILGKGKKDLSALFTLAAADHFLKPGGKLAFLLPRVLFKSGGAAEGFRALRLPGGEPLKVLGADDFPGQRLFSSSSAQAGVLYLEKGSPTIIPFTYRNCRRQGERVECEHLTAFPVNREDLKSPWLACPSHLQAGVSRVLGGRGDYQAREGANTGGANGVFWVEILDRPAPGLVKIRNLADCSRPPVEQREAVIEDRLLYPLLRSRDLQRWKAEPSAWIILAQDPIARKGFDLDWMRRECPHTLEYLEMFRELLEKRAVYRRYFRAEDPFYSMFDVAGYTLSPVKVAWPRIADDIQAAVVQARVPPIICQETMAMIACGSEDEAWYVAGLLNSLPVRYALRCYSPAGSKGYAGPHIFRYLAFPGYKAGLEQRKVAERARGAAIGLLAAEDVDSAAAEIYGLSNYEVEQMREDFAEIERKK